MDAVRKFKEGDTVWLSQKGMEARIFQNKLTTTATVLSYSKRYPNCVWIHWSGSKPTSRYMVHQSFLDLA